MKRICKTFAVLLVMAIALYSFSITAGATEVSNTQDGLVASITSEKDSYKSNEDIELTFKVTNTNDFAVENLSLEAIIPDGLTLKNNADTTASTVSLGSGESLELTLTAVKESSVITVPIGDSTEPPTQTQPVATETAENTTVMQTDSIQATTTKVNSATSDTVSTNGSDNTNIQTGKTISYLLVGLICLVCLAVAVISFRFRKKAVKYLSLVLCVCIAVGSVAFVGVTNTMAQETSQNLSFEVSKTIIVDSLNYELKSVISYSVTIDLSMYEEYQVSEAIDDLSSSDDFDNLSDDEKASKYMELLQEFSDKGLVKKGSIDYDNGIVGFECKNGTQYLIEVKLHSHENEWNNFENFYPNSTKLNTYANNTTRSTLNTMSVGKITSINVVNTAQNTLKSKSLDNTQSISAVIMCDWYTYGERTDIDNYYNSLVNTLENNGIKTSLFFNPTIQNYKTALINKDIIDISEHGLRYKNSTILATTEIPNEIKDKAYKDDLEKHRIIKEKSGGEDHYYISSKFFEYYYKDGTKLDDSIVFLESCYGFGENGKNDYNYADSFIKAGAKAVVGYNHVTIGPYIIKIENVAICELLKGNTIGDSIAIAKAQCGLDSEIYCKKTGLDLPEMPNSPIIRGNPELKLTDKSMAGQISGIVCEEENRKEVINDVLVEIYNSDNKKVGETSTGNYVSDDEGHFIINALSEGDYKFVFSKDGYNEKTLDVQVKNGDDQVLVITMENDNGILSASVISSDNTPLPDVRVDAYLKAESGTQYVGNTYTDDKGNFSMELQGGSYELRFNKDGYETTSTTITISKDVMTVLKDPIIMEKEDTYKDDFINAILESEGDLWGGDSLAVVIKFLDLNFDGKPEFIVQFGDNGYSLSSTAPSTVLYYENNNILKAKSWCSINDELAGYYDKANNQYLLLQSSKKFSSGYDDNNNWDLDNYILNFDGNDVSQDIYSSMKHRYNATDGTEKNEYYAGAELSNSIIKEEYDSINSKIVENCVNVNMQTDKIYYWGTFKMYSDSEKRQALEKAYDSFTYDKY